MFEAEECRKRGAQKLASAALNPKHKRKLIDAAQAWFLLADNVKRLEESFRYKRMVTKP
jgi:hypothetical protein